MVIVKLFIVTQIQQNISEINSEDVFEREIKLCEEFCFHEETEDVKITFNVSSQVMTIWVHYNSNRNAERGTKVLNALLKRRKLNLVGYHPWEMKKYPAAEWEEREKTCEYTFQCLILILICIFMMLIIGHIMNLMVILILILKINCICFYYRVKYY